MLQDSDFFLNENCKMVNFLRIKSLDNKFSYKNSYKFF